MKLRESDRAVTIVGTILSSTAVVLVIVGLILAHNWK
jgi:hypothetical protein